MLALKHKIKYMYINIHTIIIIYVFTWSRIIIPKLTTLKYYNKKWYHLLVLSLAPFIRAGVDAMPKYTLKALWDVWGHDKGSAEIGWWIFPSLQHSSSLVRALCSLPFTLDPVTSHLRGLNFTASGQRKRTLSVLDNGYIVYAKVDTSCFYKPRSFLFSFFYLVSIKKGIWISINTQGPYRLEYPL